MIEHNFYIEGASWQYDEQEIKRIRKTVFVDEQGVPEAEEFDDEDPFARHFLAKNLQSTVIGTARLLKDGRIGRIAVDAQWRGKKVGAALLRSAIEAAQQAHLTQVKLAAQIQALGFYHRFGFKEYGEKFDDGGIAHLWMSLQLNLPEAVKEPFRREQSKAATEPLVLFDDLQSYRQHLLTLITRCNQSLSLYLHHLETQVLNHTPIIEAIKTLAIQAYQPQIRILVRDSSQAVQSGHRLIGLSQRLSSVIQIRNPDNRHKELISAYILGDDGEFIWRDYADRWEGEFHTRNRRKHRLLAEQFSEIWEHGKPDINVRRIDL